MTLPKSKANKVRIRIVNFISRWEKRFNCRDGFTVRRLEPANSATLYISSTPIRIINCAVGTGDVAQH